MGLDEIFQEIKMEEKESEMSNSVNSKYREWEEIGMMSHLDSVRSVEIYDKNYLISSGDDCLIKLFDISNPCRPINLLNLREHNAPIFVTLLFDSLLISAGLEGVIKAWDLNSIITDHNHNHHLTYNVNIKS